MSNLNYLEDFGTSGRKSIAQEVWALPHYRHRLCSGSVNDALDLVIGSVTVSMMMDLKVIPAQYMTKVTEIFLCMYILQYDPTHLCLSESRSARILLQSTFPLT
jgi:hypothetical protein